MKCQLLEGMYSVNNYLDNKYRPKPTIQIVRLAKAKVGTTHKCHKSSNGEDFAIELRYGKPPSQQSEPQVCCGGGCRGLHF